MRAGGSAALLELEGYSGLLLAWHSGWRDLHTGCIFHGIREGLECKSGCRPVRMTGAGVSGRSDPPARISVPPSLLLWSHLWSQLLLVCVLTEDSSPRKGHCPSLGLPCAQQAPVSLGAQRKRGHPRMMALTLCHGWLPHSPRCHRSGWGSIQMQCEAVGSPVPEIQRWFEGNWPSRTVSTSTPPTTSKQPALCPSRASPPRTRAPMSAAPVTTPTETI